MGSVAITHPETGAEIVVPFEAYDTHYRQSGWMTHAELAEHRARIAQCATQTSWTTGREAGVSVWMDTRRMEPDYRTLPLYMDGVAAGPSRRGYTRWRHPVYGNRDAWVTQEAHPYFSRAVEPLGPAAGIALRGALEDVTRQLSG